MTKVLVTGANGHVGANTVRSLLQREHEVIAMVREGSDLRGLEGLQVEYRYADLMDAEAVRRAMIGCEVVLHTAAVYALWAKNPDEILRPSIVGTENVYNAAQAEGVRRIVHTSSINAVGYSESPAVLRTSDEWHDDVGNPYYVAKVRGEQEAIRLAETTGIDTIRLCPAVVLGPLDYRMTPSTRTFVLELINGVGKTWKGGTNLVHVSDVGRVHALAVDHGKPGERYILGGENVDVLHVGESIKKWTGTKPNHIGTGRTFALVYGGVVEYSSRLLGKEPRLTRSTVSENVDRYAYFDCSDTYRDFAYQPIGTDATIRDAIRWALYMGWIELQLDPEFLEQLAPDEEWQRT